MITIVMFLLCAVWTFAILTQCFRAYFYVLKGELKMYQIPTFVVVSYPATLVLTLVVYCWEYPAAGLVQFLVGKS